MSPAFKWSRYRRIEVNAVGQDFPRQDRRGMTALAYKMVATRHNETITSERSSAYITLSKVRVWVSEGWNVTIADEDGKKLSVADFESLVSAMHPLPASAHETAIAPDAEAASEVTMAPDVAIASGASTAPDAAAPVTAEAGPGTDNLETA